MRSLKFMEMNVFLYFMSRFNDKRKSQPESIVKRSYRIYKEQLYIVVGLNLYFSI